MICAGVIARHSAIFPYLKSQLTADVVQKYFYHLIDSSVRDTPCVTRYELPGTHALNFVLQHSLGGGGVASLRFDPQVNQLNTLYHISHSHTTIG